MKPYEEWKNETLICEFRKLLSDTLWGVDTLKKISDLEYEILRRMRIDNFSDDALLSYAVSAYLFTYTGTHPIDFSLFADDIRHVFNINDNAINRQVWIAVMRKAGRENELV